MVGRQSKILVVVVSAVVLAVVLILSTATADTAEDRLGPVARPPGARVTQRTDDAASSGTQPGGGAPVCTYRVGCHSSDPTPAEGRGRSAAGTTGGLGPSGAPTKTSGAPSGAAASDTTRPVTATSTAAPATTTTTPSSTPGSTGTGASWWRPPAVLSWQWELDHPLDLASASDMGTGASTYLGAPAPDPSVYDIDGFDNTASTVSALHARGDRVICYIEVGAAENYRSDYSQFPAADLGRLVSGYPSERYLNIADATVVRVIEARIAMCAAKGFDAVEPDIDDSYTDSTGFAITQAENVHYDTTLAAYAHGLGLAWGLKNGDDPGFAASMEPAADFALDEQCHQYDTCSSFAPFVSGGKAVLEVEYSAAPSQFCPAANAANEDALKMDVSLSGGRIPCR